MEPILQHFREYYRVYIMVAVCVLPIIVVFRRWAVPTILYLVEFCIYTVMMHVLVCGVVYLAAWFKDQSTMKRARGVIGEDFNPGWKTPLIEFWDRSQYTPSWLVYVEIVFLVAIAVLMWRYRPIRTQQRKSKTPPSKKVSAAGKYSYKK